MRRRRLAAHPRSRLLLLLGARRARRDSPCGRPRGPSRTRSPSTLFLIGDAGQAGRGRRAGADQPAPRPGSRGRARRRRVPRRQPLPRGPARAGRPEARRDGARASTRRWTPSGTPARACCFVPGNHDWQKGGSGRLGVRQAPGAARRGARRTGGLVPAERRLPGSRGRGRLGSPAARGARHAVVASRPRAARGPELGLRGRLGGRGRERPARGAGAGRRARRRGARASPARERRPARRPLHAAPAPVPAHRRQGRPVAAAAAHRLDLPGGARVGRLGAGPVEPRVPPHARVARWLRRRSTRRSHGPPATSTCCR